MIIYIYFFSFFTEINLKNFSFFPLSRKKKHKIFNFNFKLKNIHLVTKRKKESKNSFSLITRQVKPAKIF